MRFNPQHPNAFPTRDSFLTFCVKVNSSLPSSAVEEEESLTVMWQNEKDCL